MGLAEGVQDLLSSGGLIAVPAALFGGVLTGLNPCCLPIYPAAAAACCADRADCGAPTRKLSISSALALTLGIAAATTALGVAAGLGGKTMTTLSGGWAYAIAFVPLLAGAHILGFLKLPMPRLAVGPRVSGVGSAFIAGLLLALVFGPCGTPLLASLLSYVAFEGQPVYGGALLFVYGLGIALPVVLLGATAAKLAARLERSGKRVWVDRATGGLLVAMGLYVLWTA